MYKDIISTLLKGKALSNVQINFFLEETVRGNLSLVQQAAVLSALNVKGIEPKELYTFVRYMQKAMPESINFPGAIDICGTGGSGLARINTSTISAFILSVLGIPVAKHGNKAASGRFGSFDLLEKLGINIDLSKNELDRLADNLGLVFMYARKFHPVMKHFAAVRKEMGVPTVFNLLGPLLNPANTKYQIIGTAFRNQMSLIAETGKKLGLKKLMVVCGADGLDEVTLSGKTYVTELKNGRIRSYALRPSSFGISSCDFKEFQGGSAKFNSKIALDILHGRCLTRHIDLILINVALALKLSDKTPGLIKAYQLAKNCVLNGKAYSNFLAYKQLSYAPSILLEIFKQKREELKFRKKNLPLKKLIKQIKPSVRNFKSALQCRGFSLIAEIKKSSPSIGQIRQGKFDVARIAKNYEEAGARVISVVTEQKFFGGSLEYLNKAKQATVNTPLLCKDFIIDEYQIYEARKFGADAVLLIASILSVEQIESFLKTAKNLNMDCLVEVHNEEELNLVLQTGADIIGVNNRDLHTFKVDLRTTRKLASQIPTDKIMVSESGIKSRKDIKSLPKRIDAVLVGTVLMKQRTPGLKIRSLLGDPLPLLKICGVQSVPEALLCQKLKVDLIGLNFVLTSPRRISYQAAGKIIQALKKHSGVTRVAGVFMDQDEEEIFSTAKHLGLDFIQLHGDESIAVIKKSPVPVIKAICISGSKDVKRAKRFAPHVAYLLLDSRQPGSGDSFPYKLLKGFKYPFILAGGINKQNVRTALKNTRAIGVDVASGVETQWKRDLCKIKELVKLLS